MTNIIHYPLFKCLCVITCFVFMFVINVCSKQDGNIGNTYQNEQHRVDEFLYHKLIRPKIYHGHQKRQIATSRAEESFFHLDHIIIKLSIAGEELELDLTLNKHLIPKGFFRKIQENGIYKIIHPSLEEVDLCHYSGKVKNKPNSWVALSTCDGLSGVIYDGQEIHYIEKKGLEDDDEHILYKHSDLVDQDKTCGNKESRKGHDNNVIRHKRAIPLVRRPYNANRESKYVELLLVVDNRKYKELNESISKVEDYCKNIANIVNGLYAPLDIFIALTGVVIWTEQDEINFSASVHKALTDFLVYRKEHLVRSHPNDNAQIITKIIFEDGAIGKALTGSICTYEYSGGISADHSSVVGVTAITVAHMLGHNFGMLHDTNNCTCPDDRCIMAPTSTLPTHWSSCSLDTLKFAFDHGMDYCLKNKPVALFHGPVCGNGFVEHGEDCDYGLPDHCNNTCCDATTCMLHKGATCATGECCDLMTCKLKISGTICRSADSECDLPEYCTGKSEYCPENFYKMDTEICQDGRAFCYHGTCRTQDDQCSLLWGEGIVSQEDCYTLNLRGIRNGKCGYDMLNHTSIKCGEEDIFCGRLQCQNLEKKLQFGMQNASILSNNFINKNGTITSCISVIIDLGIDQADPGLVPDGAKCGDGKMCLNQKCVSVNSLRENRTCTNNCYGNGWCNNLGHCHCKDGYLLPHCQHVWLGGSVDSGQYINLIVPEM